MEQKKADLEKVPSKWDPWKNSPKEKMKKLKEEVKKYKEKIEQMEDGEEKTRLKNSLTIVEKFLTKNKNLWAKKLTEMLNSEEHKSKEWKEFRKALNNLSDKFDKKEVRELAKEEVEKLKTMSNTEFLKYSPEERLKFITKEHLKPQDVKEWTKMTFTFTFDNQYNEELWRKTTAWQVLPTTVNVVNVWDTEYTRRWLKWEFFTKTWKRLIINEWTHIEIGKPLTKEQVEKIENINELKYKAYMWELKPESIQDEKIKKEFFGKDGKLLEKYKLDDKQKELFKQNPDIVKEAIARNMDPKFAVICFADVVKWKSIMDTWRIVTLEDMFTEFDRIKWNQSIIQKDVWDGIKVLMLREFAWNDWKEKAKALWIKDDVIKNYEHKEYSVQEFLNKAKEISHQIEDKYGIPWKVVLGQSLLESWNGQSKLTKLWNNAFWHKARPWQPSIWMMTWEYRNWHYWKEVANFRSFATLEDSFEAYAMLLSHSSRYKWAFQYKNDPPKFLYTVIASWYATLAPEKYVQNVRARLKHFWIDFS